MRWTNISGASELSDEELALAAEDLFLATAEKTQRKRKVNERGAFAKRGEVWLVNLGYGAAKVRLEQKWSKLKARLRKAKARTKAELDRAIVEEVQLITASDCQGWFTHCCYEVA